MNSTYEGGTHDNSFGPSVLPTPKTDCAITNFDLFPLSKHMKGFSGPCFRSVKQSCEDRRMNMEFTKIFTRK